jgi:hypothetical protein
VQATGDSGYDNLLGLPAVSMAIVVLRTRCLDDPALSPGGIAGCFWLVQTSLLLMGHNKDAGRLLPWIVPPA